MPLPLSPITNHLSPIINHLSHITHHLSPTTSPLAPFRAFWWWLRQVLGDAAYENYLQSAARLAPPTGASGTPLLTREEFYLDALRRRYSTVSRCC